MRRRKQPPNPWPQDSIARRAALYMRVSTGRQAEHDLSIPDQRRQLESWCRAQGYTVAAEFIESGASAGDDRRPIFQQMIERACDGEQAFDLILVHSYSRFFREAFEQEFYLRKLAKHGVRVVSITQPVGDESEPVQAMMRKVIALFDEYQSKENAKHVIRSMKENARQGFWNGATAPLGYRLVEAEKRGTKIKKKLEIDPSRSRDRPAHFQAVSTRGWQLGRARRQRSGQMAQPQWLSHPARRHLWGCRRSQDPDQHGLHRPVAVQ
jgi:DNA invertase Pin-like site-specific DNA recombinase